MKNKEATEMLNKAIKLTRKDKVPSFKGVYIIPERKLHESGYRLMNIIGHTGYDEREKGFKYYLISICSDVIDFEPMFERLMSKNYAMCDLHLDISKGGIIHIWTKSDKRICLKYGIDLSSCSFEIL